MKPNVDDLVLCDRIGLYDRYSIWRYFPLQGPSFGDLWLTSDGRVGYAPVGLTNGSAALGHAAFGCRERLPGRQRDLPVVRPGANELQPGSQFRGEAAACPLHRITKFMSKGESLISHILGVHHVAAAIMGAKSGH
jgi:hypothetical protein